jgi:acylphosphatase
MESAVHIVVRGLVQGVGYRWFVHSRATELSLRGLVRNLPDGSVEIEAVGSRDALERLVALARTGPRAAQVTGVVVDWNRPAAVHTSFTIS